MQSKSPCQVTKTPFGCASLRYCDLRATLYKEGSIYLGKMGSENLSVEGHALFQGLSRQELDEISQRFQHLKFSFGEAVFHENDCDRDLYILVNGLVTIRISLQESGRSRRLVTYGPGTVFGEMSFLDGSPRSATVWAEADSEVLCLTFESFQVLRGQRPELAARLSLNIATEISQRLRMTSHQLRQLEDV